MAGLFFEQALLPQGWREVTTARAGGWIAAAYLGMFPSALGFMLWGYAVGNLPVATSTSLLYLVPAVAIGISFFWLGEIPLPIELIGGLVVIVGVIAVSHGDRILQLQRYHPGREADAPLPPG